MRLPVKYVKEGDNLNHYIDRLFFIIANTPLGKSCGCSDRINSNSNQNTDAYGKVTRHH